MYDILLSIILVISVLLILAVVVQPAKNNPSNLTGASDPSIGKRKKARGFEAVMNRITIVLGVLFMILALLIAKFSF